MRIRSIRHVVSENTRIVHDPLLDHLPPRRVRSAAPQAPLDDQTLVQLDDAEGQQTRITRRVRHACILEPHQIVKAVRRIECDRRDDLEIDVVVVPHRLVHLARAVPAPPIGLRIEIRELLRPGPEECRQLRRQFRGSRAT